MGVAAITIGITTQSRFSCRFRGGRSREALWRRCGDAVEVSLEEGRTSTKYTIRARDGRALGVAAIVIGGSFRGGSIEGFHLGKSLKVSRKRLGFN